MKILQTVPVTLLFMAAGLAFGFQTQDDPVMKARAQRALSQGIAEGDLPPVPRVITEPPPLPAPETNYKDTHKGRAARAKRGRGRHHGKARGHGSSPQSKKKRHH